MRPWWISPWEVGLSGSLVWGPGVVGVELWPPHIADSFCQVRLLILLHEPEKQNNSTVYCMCTVLCIEFTGFLQKYWKGQFISFFVITYMYFGHLGNFIRKKSNQAFYLSSIFSNFKKINLFGVCLIPILMRRKLGLILNFQLTCFFSMASFMLKSLSFIQALRGGKQPPGLTRESSTVETSVAAWLHEVWADLGGKEREAWLSRTPLNPKQWKIH